MKQLVTDLKIGTAVEHVKRLIGLDVIMRAGLKARLAILLDHFERLVSVLARDFDDDFIGFCVDVAFARR